MAIWTLGAVLRQKRKAKGPRWTQEHLGRLAGLNKDQITKAETGKRVSLETLDKIARALGVTLDGLRAEATAADANYTPAGVSQPTGSGRVRSTPRTRLDQVEPLAPMDILPTATLGGGELNMAEDPDLNSLTRYWQHLSWEQREALVDVAATMFRRGRREHTGGREPAGKGSG
jgi:transcriptional regulator with XRE-family HTH domain